jgi:hypothetical protein
MRVANSCLVSRMFLGLPIGTSIMKNIAFYISHFGPFRAKFLSFPILPFGLGSLSILPQNCSFYCI